MPGRGRRVEPTLAPEKRGPTQWGGPAESSVPTRAPASQTWLRKPYRTRIDRPIRNVVFGVMPFRAQRLLTVVWYFTAIEPSVSPDLIL